MALSRSRRTPAYRGRAVSNEFIYGNTARELKELGREGASELKLSHHARRNRERAKHMNPAYILFLTFAMVCTVAICIQYLMMRAQMTNMVKELSALEITLSELKAENDDTENRIKGAVDLEEIKYRAMNELGMQYANEDQIVSYECEDTDYVRQLVDIE
ncbi:MAG: cell division protein FtsL [Lachnospiraceae bacterium]|nr:cell division protein FtsL [Lachnospiraceae bacterium]MBR6470033.1 cell division protein FtsL [Lachnospiraceae bacterium]MBR6485476.1 cell division protein FtsL [Lachnospiraceae bacterium]